MDVPRRGLFSQRTAVHLYILSAFSNQRTEDPSVLRSGTRERKNEFYCSPSMCCRRKCKVQVRDIKIILEGKANMSSSWRVTILPRTCGGGGIMTSPILRHSELSNMFKGIPKKNCPKRNMRDRQFNCKGP